MTDRGPEAALGASPPVRRPRRWLQWLLAGAVLVIGALVYEALWRARPIGSGPAGPAVSREAFARTWTKRPVLLLGLGDSVTAGFGASPEHGYFDRLTANPPGEFSDMQGINLRSVLPNLTVKNLSISGTISSEHLRDQVEPLPVAGPKHLGLVVMTSGGNDIIHNYGRTPPREGAMYGATLDQARPWIERFEQRLDRMVALIRSRFPGGAHIFLANIYDPTDGVGDAPNAGLPAWKDGLEIIAAYNDVIARCAEKHEFVHLVPMRETFLGHGIHCRQFWRPHYDPRDPHYWYYENLEDPNDRGYDALRRIFLNEISRVLAPRR